MNKTLIIIIACILNILGIIVFVMNMIEMYENPKKEYIYIINNNKIKKINVENELELENLEKPVIYVQGSVHGNEPAGSKVSMKILNEIRQNRFNKYKGTIIIFPYPNIEGIKLNQRFVPELLPYDINRSFTNSNTRMIPNKIMKIVRNSDFIIDLHEGWGYHLEDKGSVGSTLGPTTKYSTKLSIEIIDQLNKNIKEEYKKFSMNNSDDCSITTTLRCYSSKLNKHYILVETTGQNNKQPINIRVDQMYTIITHVFDNFLY